MALAHQSLEDCGAHTILVIIFRLVGVSLDLLALNDYLLRYLLGRVLA